VLIVFIVSLWKACQMEITKCMEETIMVDETSMRVSRIEQFIDLLKHLHPEDLIDNDSYLYATRIELPTCEYGVSHDGGESVDPCGKPAHALWYWNKEDDENYATYDILWLCEHHDAIVSAEEQTEDEKL